MNDEFFQFYDNNKMGIKAINGNIIIPAIYDFVEPFSDGFFNVTLNNEHAYFDVNGKIILPFQGNYEFYGNFKEGLASVRKDNKWGFIDITGQVVIHPQFHFVNEFSDGIAIVRHHNNLHGAIDKTGKLIIDYKFKMLSDFHNGYARCGDYKTYGLINKLGEIVVPQKFISIGLVNNNKVMVVVIEEENYKEGILTIGGTIEWNNNLENLNQFNLKKKQFTIMCVELIQAFYKDGCPCEYQRFRNFIQWNKPIRFIDQEGLFYIFVQQLNKVDENLFQCTSCGTIYKNNWEEYSINLRVLNVKIIKHGNFIEKGANIPSHIPVSLGFQGYNLDKLKNEYFETDNQTVINYLKEK